MTDIKLRRAGTRTDDVIDDSSQVPQKGTDRLLCHNCDSAIVDGVDASRMRGQVLRCRHCDRLSIV
jgi:RNase P subunit RPR2